MGVKDKHGGANGVQKNVEHGPNPPSIGGWLPWGTGKRGAGPKNDEGRPKKKGEDDKGPGEVRPDRSPQRDEKKRPEPDVTKKKIPDGGGGSQHRGTALPGHQKTAKRKTGSRSTKRRKGRRGGGGGGRVDEKRGGASGRGGRTGWSTRAWAKNL